MNTLKFFAVSLCVASLALAQGASAKSEVVVKETTGEAAVVDGNKDRAQKEARDKALRDAVEQVAGVLVSSDTLTQNSQLISDRIFANATGYIRSFEVVKQEEKGGVMYVTVKAQVGRAQLDKDLQGVQALVKRLGSRKVLIITQEQSFAKDGLFKSEALATELTNAFRKDGWEIIDQKFAGGGAMELASAVTISGTPASEKIADIKTVDFIVYGTASYRYQQPEGLFAVTDPKKPQQVFPITGEYNLSVFATEDGRQLGKIAGKLITDIKKGVDPTISYERSTLDSVRAKAPEIIREFRAALYEGLRDQQLNGKRMNVTVVGLNDYTSVENFSKVLRESITGVNAVGGETKFGGGKAEYEITFVGNSGDLAQRLNGRTFKGKKVSVSKVDKAGVEITLAK